MPRTHAPLLARQHAVEVGVLGTCVGCNQPVTWGRRATRCWFVGQLQYAGVVPAICDDCSPTGKHRVRHR